MALEALLRMCILRDEYRPACNISMNVACPIESCAEINVFFVWVLQGGVQPQHRHV